MPAPEHVVLKVEGVSKKFCRNLKRSLWYGVKDLGAEFFRRQPDRAHLRRDEFWALQDMSFTLHAGETIGLIGRNGAGKSTVLKLVNGLIKPDTGRISIWGRIGALIELGTGFDPLLTGRENIYINAAVLGIRKEETDRLLDDIIAFAEIGDFIDTPLKNYSSGMKVRLGFSVACNLNPDTLLIDEILSVGDASFRERSYRRLLDYRARGGAIIFISHNLAAVEAVCDHVIWLDQGQAVMAGEPAEVIYHYEKYSQEITRQVEQRFFSQAQPVSEQDDVLIEAVQCYDLDGKAQDAFEFDQPFEIRLTFRTRSEVHNPYFLLGLSKGVQGAPPFFTASMLADGTQLGAVDGAGTVSCVLKQPYLTPGHYDITVAVQRERSGMLGKKYYAVARQAGHFEIKHERFVRRYPQAIAADLPRTTPVAFHYVWQVNHTSPEDSQAVFTTEDMGNTEKIHQEPL